MLHLFDSICCVWPQNSFSFWRFTIWADGKPQKSKRMTMRKPSEGLFQCFFVVGTGSQMEMLASVAVYCWFDSGGLSKSVRIFKCTSKPLPASCDWYAAWMGSKDPVSSYHRQWRCILLMDYIWHPSVYMVFIRQSTHQCLNLSNCLPDFLHLTLPYTSTLLRVSCMRDSCKSRVACSV